MIPDDLVGIVDDGQPPNLMARHLPLAGLQAIINVADEDLIRHTISHDCVSSVYATRN